MEVAFAGGEFDVIVDLALDRVAAYDGSDAFHNIFGGRTYYRSLSGLSGAGWVPGTAARVSVCGYRTETRVLRPIVPQDAFGIKVAIPTHRYLAGVVDRDYPMMIWDVTGIPCLAPVSAYWLGHVALVDEAERRTFRLGAFITPDGELESFELPYAQLGGGRWPLRRIMPALYPKVRFQWPADWPDPDPFWSRLGLHPYKGCMFKIANGVCWDKIPADQLVSVDQMQEVAPANTLVLTPTVFIQREAGHHYVVGRSEDGARTTIDYLTPREAVAALSGDTAHVLGTVQRELDRLEAEGRAKRDWLADPVAA